MASVLWPTIRIFRANLLFAAGALFAGLVVLEFVLRIMDGVGFAQWPNFIKQNLSLLSSAYPTAYHPDLGYIPRPGYQGDDNIWRTTVTILDDGVRANGPDQGKASTGAPILSVGDSFVFGDEVSDHETWPAYLQGLSGRMVINAGVFGFGLDQIVLRAEKVVASIAPEILIVGIIQAGIDRTEYDVLTGVAKPYFDLADGGLALRNSPVPHLRPDLDAIGPMREILGHSYFLNLLMRRIGTTRWWYAGGSVSRRVHRDRIAVSCRLMGRLGRLSQGAGLRTLLVVQYTPNEARTGFNEVAAPVIQCARDQGIEVIDFFPALRELLERDPAAFDSLYRGHMSPAGNRFVAERIWQRLAR